MAKKPKLELDEDTSARMGRIRQSGTAAELAVRAAATRLGLHYRTRNRDLPGSPDLANRTRKWAVFVHGCFWHRHNGCIRTTTPKRNREFWEQKFAANIARDARAVRELRRMGYEVAVLWECEADDAAVTRSKLAPISQRGEKSWRSSFRPPKT